MTNNEKPLVRALRGRRAAKPPVWLMRQAGRYLAEYRAVRQNVPDFLRLCYTPELAAEVTLQPLRRFAFDAAILFSDILVVPHALGRAVWFEEGEGPKLEPLRTSADVAGLESSALLERLDPVLQTVGILSRELPEQTTLIGFSGAPWTLAAYMVEGAGSKDFAATREMAWRAPETFSQLIDVLVAAIGDYLCAQIAAGAEVVQLFDSWAGVLSSDEHQRWCVEPIGRIVEHVRGRFPNAPIIAFPRGSGARYRHFAERVAVDGLGLDTSVDRNWAASNLGPDLVPCLQGNLDPVALLVGGKPMLEQADRLLEAWQNRPFIFNLGHGVLPQTPPENVAELVGHLKSAST